MTKHKLAKQKKRRNKLVRIQHEQRQVNRMVPGRVRFYKSDQVEEEINEKELREQEEEMAKI